MKDNLFEMLLHLFEKTLTQLKEHHASTNQTLSDAEISAQAAAFLSAGQIETNNMTVKAARPGSMRIYSVDEQLKFSKASYQFLVRLSSWGVVALDTVETIINQLIFSESHLVSLQETKWTVRNTLASSLDAEQLAFLDLVLYHKEDELPAH